MNLFDRIARFLAQHQILADVMKERSAGLDRIAKELAEERQRNAATIEALTAAHKKNLDYWSQVYYAQGERFARDQLAEQINQVIAERMGGGDDFVTAEDLERARKGLVH